MQSDTSVVKRSGRGLFGIPLSRWIIISMFVGVLVGWMFPARAKGFDATDLAVLSTVFLRLIKSVIIPLLFSTLVIGIAGHGDDLAKVGRLAWRSILYFEIVTTLALVIGLAAVNLVKPGEGISLAGATADAGKALAENKATPASFVEHLIPQSAIDSAAKNEVLPFVVFCILFAVALAQVQNVPAKKFMLSLCESLAEIMFKYVALVMAYAPIGIGAAMAVTVSKSGITVLKTLSMLVGTCYGALVAFVLLVLLPVAMLFRVPVGRFVRAVKEPWLIAFSSASSEAALPLALERMEQLGVPRRIVSFVLPTGYSFNLDGTTLYLSLASMFVAQAAGVHLSLPQQIGMMLTLMITSKGVAAVPRASLVILSGTLTQFGLPLEGIAVILGVDALMDMARTSTNVLGNCLATVVMARWEGVFDQPGQDTPLADAMAGQPLSVPSIETPR